MHSFFTLILETFNNIFNTPYKPITEIVIFLL